MFEYRGTVTKILDGDTVRVRLDLGCDVRIDLTLRLMGIDAPEMSTPEGPVSKEWLTHQLATSTVVTVQTIKDRRERYGRYLAYLYLTPGPDGGYHPPDSLNMQMVDLGLARLYDGGART